MKNIVIITSNAIRHRYFKILFSNAKGINVLKTYVEADDQNTTLSRKEYTDLDVLSCHFTARHNTEYDFFSDVVEYSEDRSQSSFIKKNEINEGAIVQEIAELNPDFIITYGCSIIKPALIKAMKNKIINVHLGLSPYYFGAGTNFHALVNNDFQCVGYTFMYMDEGIDTGEIIHQARAVVEPFDNPHQIGNRLIKSMVKDFIELIEGFDQVKTMVAVSDASGPTYKIRDATDACTETLYKNFGNGSVLDYLRNKSSILKDYPVIEQSFVGKSN